MFLVRFVDEGTRVESYLAVCFVLVYIFGDKKKRRGLGLCYFCMQGLLPALRAVACVAPHFVECFLYKTSDVILCTY